MAAFAPPDSGTISQMDLARARLQSEVADCFIKVGMSTSWQTVFSGWVGGDPYNTSQEAATGRVRMLQGEITQLCDFDWFSVMAGEKSSKWWFERMEFFHGQLNDVVKDLDDWTFGGLGAAFVTDTSKAVAAKVEQGVESAAQAAKFGIPAIGLLAALVCITILVLKLK